MSYNIFAVLNDKGAAAYLNYTTSERKLIKEDYIYARYPILIHSIYFRYIADLYTYYHNGEGYLLPHLPFEKEKFMKDV